MIACPVGGCPYEIAGIGDAAGAVLLKFHLDSHTTSLQQRKQGKPNKIETPKLRSGIGPDDFNFWRERWDNYKRVNRLDDVQDIRDQLVNCCKTNSTGIYTIHLARPHRQRRSKTSCQRWEG